jgi:gliding motility-associated-like protein
MDNEKLLDMKDIKEILDNYSETPSDAVWERLNARLDAEMPVQKPKTSAWKWAASALAVVAVSGGVAFGVWKHQNNNQEVTAMNTAEQTVETAQLEPVPTVGTCHGASLQKEDVTSVAETQNLVSRQTKESDVPMEREKRDAVAETSNTKSPKTETEAPRTNVRQEVLPPNSTLAKQLAADPVLRTLSDENVEWTPPTHLSIPNLFTPNGDGVNDMFVIEGLESYSSPRLVVRDKNNRIVYQSANYRNNWDGGSCPEGVYSYEFTFTYQGIGNQAVGKVRIMRG